MAIKKRRTVRLEVSPGSKAHSAARLARRCLQNIAFYRAGQGVITKDTESDFWKTTQHSFALLVVLDWYKLFIDTSSSLHWANFLVDPNDFGRRIVNVVHMSEAELHEMILDTKTYRDKYVAHADEDVPIVQLDFERMRLIAGFLLDFLICKEGKFWSEDMRRTSTEFFGAMRQDAQSALVNCGLIPLTVAQR